MLDILYTVLCAVIVIGFLVLIHEGGHYLAAKAFRVRVTEFMIGLPGPSIGFTVGETKFGLTAIPLGGYAKVCGMETGEIDPHLKQVMAYIYRNGMATLHDVACACDISEEDAEYTLEELLEWGSIIESGKRDECVYKTPESRPSKKDKRFARKHCLPAPLTLAEGSARNVTDDDLLFNIEYSKQYRSLPFWKRSVIVLAGITVNLLFAILAFVFIYSIIGVDITTQSGEVVHYNANPIQSLQAGFSYIGLVFQAIIGLFNPQTAAQTVSESSSIVGIAVMSADFFSKGLADALFFMAAISVSLGLMNLIPIPPLDGGRFLVEIIQKITGRDVPMKVMGYVSMVGMALFLCFFVFMLNQDVQRFIFGNW